MLKRTLLLITLSAALVLASMQSLAGKYSLSAKTGDGDLKSQLTLTETDGAWTATISAGSNTMTAKKVEREGNTVKILLPYEGSVITVKLNIEGDEVKGEYQTEGGDTGPITGKRL
jgi:hypothetical protein